jgi:hypothetical protein
MMMKLKRYMWLAICSTVLLVAGCASDYTDGADGEIIVLSDGRAFELTHKLGDTYGLIKINKEELEDKLNKINKKLGN